MKPAGALAPTAPETNAARGLEVISANPQGAAEDSSPITIVFNKPVRELSLAEDDKELSIAIEPPVEARWQWIGTSALTLAAEEPLLRRATPYRVTVPAGITAVDGSTLPAPYRFEFETERPALVALETSSPDQLTLRPRDFFTIEYDPPVSAAALRASLSLLVTPQAGSQEFNPALAHQVDVEVAPSAEDAHRLEVRSREPLPLASRVRVSIGADLISLAGPLPTGQVEDWDYQTYAPLSVKLDCGEQTPPTCQGAPRITFSNPVKYRALAAALRLSPPVPFKLERDVDEDYGRTFTLFGPFKSGVTYSLKVAAGVRDAFDQELGQAATLPFSLQKLGPTAAIGAEPGFLEPALGDGVPIASVGLRRVEVTSAELSPAELADYLNSERARTGTRAAFLRARPQAKKHALAVRGELEQPSLQQLPFRQVLASGRFGAFGLLLDGQPSSEPYLLQPTNLALTTKLSDYGGLVWLTRLSDGAPVAGASIELVGLGSAPVKLTTDAHGLAALARPSLRGFRKASEGAMLIARSGGDWTYRPLRQAASREPSNVELDYAPRKLCRLFVDRGIYRPAEPVYVKGWLRQEMELGTTPVTNAKLVLELRRGDQKLGTQTVTTNAFGGFSGKFVLDKHAPLGAYEVRAAGASAGFRLGEYRSAQFFAELAAERPTHTRGERAAFALSGEYLFGAKMAGARAHYRASFSTRHFHPPGAEAFETDAWGYLGGLPSASSMLPDGTLDAQGNAKVEVDTVYSGFGPAELTLHAGVSDVTHQESGASASTLVHPGSFYLGLRVPAKDVLSGRAFVPEVLVAAIDGRRLAGHAVTLELRQQKSYFWDGASERPTLADKAVASCKLQSTAAARGCALIAGEPGFYAVVAQAKDEREHAIYAAAPLYVSGQASGSLPAPERGSLSVELDKRQYEPGDTARAIVHAPFKNAEVLVTLERAGIHWFEQRRLRDGVGVFAIPVSEALGRNVNVVVQATRGRTKPPDTSQRRLDGDQGAPALLTASARLELDQERQRLSVEVMPALTDAAPGERVPVKLRVRDRGGRGHRAELAVYAVDEGVLMLTGYRTPDVLDAFTPLRPSQVMEADTRDELGWLFQPELFTGRSSGRRRTRVEGANLTIAPTVRFAGRPAREHFATTPYFEPSVETDADGNAEVVVPLSESLTRYRVMAVATSADDFYGSGQASIGTSLKLMARPALPRFARVGDRFDATLAITSKGFDPGSVRVKIATQGLLLDGPAEKTMPLGRDASTEVRFAVRTQKRGTARVRFEVEAGDRKDAVQVELPVTLPIVPQAVAAYGKAEPTSGERLGDFRAMRSDYGSLKVSLSSTALVGLDNGFEQLLEYPYGCTEQLSSRLMPLLPLRDLAKDFGIRLPANLGDELERTIAAILERQQSDGGFALWPDSYESLPWLTAYVFATLHEASRRGAALPADVLGRAYDYLARELKGDAEDLQSSATQSYIAYVFAEYGRPAQDVMRALWQGQRRLPLFSKALLLHAFALAAHGDAPWLALRKHVIENLSLELTSRLHFDGNRAIVKDESQAYELLFDSSARSTAMVLRALLAANPKHPLAERLARGLLSLRQQGSWRSTQETSFALMALDAYRHAREAEPPDFEALVWLGQRELGRARYRRRSLGVQSFSVDAAELRASGGQVLALEKSGRGTLFYEALLRYAPARLPSTELDRGFSIRHALHRVTERLPAAVAQGYAPGETRFDVGDVVLGELVLVTPSPRTFVVADIPLPAGLEAIDQTLATTSSVVPEQVTESWSHEELRDDRVVVFADALKRGVYRYRYLARATTRGRFVVPPARAEEMYAPEVFGRTAALEVVVR